MRDEITINLRALSERTLNDIYDAIDRDLNDIPDEDNQAANETLLDFINTEF